MHYFLPQLKKKEKHSTHSQWCGLRKWCYGKYRQTCNLPSSSSSYTVSLHYEETTNRIVLNAFVQIYLLSIYPKTRNRYTHTHTHRSPFASFICCWCFFLFVHFSYAFFGCCCLDLRMFVCVVCVIISRTIRPCCDMYMYSPDVQGFAALTVPATCMQASQHLSVSRQIIIAVVACCYCRPACPWYRKYALCYIYVFMVDWCTGSYP